MRILFAGTPEVAVPSLLALADRHEVLGVLTRAPAPVGRKRVLTVSPVEKVARSRGLNVLTPGSLHSEELLAFITDAKVDAVAVVAYGKLVPEQLLAVPTHGWINLHFSLLPRWRGAAPVQYAIAAGDTVTGTSVFRIDEGLDTGLLFSQRPYPIPEDITSGELLDALSIRGAEHLTDVFSQIESGSYTLSEQSGEPTYAPSLSTADSRIDFSFGSEQIEQAIRAYTPEPGAWTMLSSQRIRLAPVKRASRDQWPDGEYPSTPGSLAGAKRAFVSTGTEPLQLTDVTPAGKKTMDGAAWLRGLHSRPAVFESESNE